MAPLVPSKNYSNFTVQYIDNLFSIHKNPKELSKHFNMDQFFMVQDLVFNDNLSMNCKNKLLAVYPKLKVSILPPFIKYQISEALTRKGHFSIFIVGPYFTCTISKFLMETLTLFQKAL